MNIFPFMTLKAETKYLLDTFTLRQALEKMEFYRYSVIPVFRMVFLSFYMPTR